MEASWIEMEVDDDGDYESVNVWSYKKRVKNDNYIKIHTIVDDIHNLRRVGSIFHSIRHS